MHWEDKALVTLGVVQVFAIWLKVAGVFNASWLAVLAPAFVILCFALCLFLFYFGKSIKDYIP